jgi:hypothetical protein
MHEPLSRQLAHILKETPPSGGLTMNYLLDRTEGRGLYLLIILLCLPFVPLISPPGLSGLLGGVVFVFSLYMSVGVKPQLPRFIGARPLPPTVRENLLEFLAEPTAAHPRPKAKGWRQRLVSGSVKFLRFVEKWSHPRRTTWMTWRLAHAANSLLLALLAFLLALPLPSAPFFPTNGLPAYAIILVAAAMMEEDGVLIWVAYALSLANVVFFISIAGTIVKFFDGTFHWVRQHFLGS